MQLFRADSFFCEVFGVWRDGFHFDKSYSFGKFTSDEVAYKKFQMWCDKGPDIEMASYSLKEGGLNLPIGIMLVKKIIVSSEDGLEMPCYEVDFTGPPLKNDA